MLVKKSYSCRFPGIPANNLKNKSLIQRTFRKYGKLNRTYVKKHLSDTLFIVVNGE